MTTEFFSYFRAAPATLPLSFDAGNFFDVQSALCGDETLFDIALKEGNWATAQIVFRSPELAETFATQRGPYLPPSHQNYSITSYAGMEVDTWKRTICEHVPPTPKRILDVGSGTGVHVVRLAKAFPSAYILALEPQANLAELCRQNLISSSLRTVEVRESTLEQFIDNNQSVFDLVIANFSLAYMSRPAKILGYVSQFALQDFCAPDDDNPIIRWASSELALNLRNLASRPFPNTGLIALAQRNKLSRVFQTDAQVFPVSESTSRGQRQFKAAELVKKKLGLQIETSQLLPHYRLSLFQKEES
jgi:SAM-dependent methyltransferase